MKSAIAKRRILLIIISIITCSLTCLSVQYDTVQHDMLDVYVKKLTTRDKIDEN